MKRFHTLFAALGLAAVVAGCGGGSSGGNGNVGQNPPPCDPTTQASIQNVVVTVIPGKTTITTKQQQLYSYALSGCTFDQPNVVWSVQEPGGGTFQVDQTTGKQTSLYIPPATPGTYHVQAVYTANGFSSQPAVGTVTVTAP